MNKSTLISLLERFELYLTAGFPLDKVVNLSAQGSSKKLLRILTNVEKDIRFGLGLANSMQKHARMPRAAISLLQNGELSGDLIGACREARQILERVSDLTKKVISALIYPVVIGVFACLMTLGLIRGVLPQITPMLLSLHVDLPILTKIVIFVSEFLTKYGLYLLGGIIVIIVLTAILYRTVRVVRFGIQSSLLIVPIIGPVLRTITLSSFFRSCGALTASGISSVIAFEKTSEGISILPIKKRLCSVLPAIKQGTTIGVALPAVLSKLPPFIAPLISAGEASGTLASSLTRAAAILDRDIEHSLKRITSLIEPLMMVAMGGIIGSIALSIMMPIYDVSKVLQH